MKILVVGMEDKNLSENVKGLKFNSTEDFESELLSLGFKEGGLLNTLPLDKLLRTLEAHDRDNIKFSYVYIDEKESV